MDNKSLMKEWKRGSMRIPDKSPCGIYGVPARSLAVHYI